MSRRIASVAAIAGLVLLAFLLFQQRESGPVEDAADAARDPHTLVIGRPADSVTLDPAATTRMADFVPIYLAYERLLEPVIESGHPTGALVGSLAESWSVSDDGRTWNFTLRPNHRFSDGTIVDADAVRDSFRRLIAVGRGPAHILEMLDTIDVPAPRTVRFHLKRPFPAFGHLLTLPMYSIVGPSVQSHAADGDGGAQWLSSNSLGSGRYRVSSWQPGQRMLLTVNPHAPSRTRYFTRVRLEVIKDAVSRLAQARRGEIDVVGTPTPGMVPRLADIPHLILRSGPGPILYYLELNNRRPPFSNEAVRRAVSLAIDRPAIIAGIFNGQARQVRGVLPEGMPGYDPSLPFQETDLRAARAQLEIAGLRPSGALRLSYTPTDATLDALAVAVQANLAELGMRVRIESLSPSAFNEKVRFAGDFDMALRAYAADFPDPWIIMDPLYLSSNAGAAGNISRYANPRVDLLLKAAGTSTEPKRRVELYRRAQEMIAADYPHSILLVANGLVAYRDDIIGVDPNFWQPDLLNIAQMARRTRGDRAGRIEDHALGD